MYECAPLTAIAGIIAVSMLAECTGKIDFALFRPLRGICRRGFLIGFFAVLMLTAFPLPYTATVWSHILSTPLKPALQSLALLWLGLQILPLLTLTLRQNNPNFFHAMRALNIVYTLLYIAGLLWLIGTFRGENALWLTSLTLALTYGLWILYPKAIDETLKHTRSSKRQQQLFYKVQRHAAAILTVLTILTIGTIAYFPPHTAPQTAPTPAEIYTHHQTDHQPRLIAITAPWSPSATVDSLSLHQLSADGVNVIRIPAIGEATAAQPWLKEYASPHAPLYILFTTRHPYGLKLPTRLNRINWQTALETFDAPATTNERTPPND
ncbi:MAG: hypothetical protein NC218_08815 [Acetobacter sp.]|nr:hypothetical protein [Acetobacter sp.]